MAMNDVATLNLDVIAATAKKLDDDLRNGRLWPGDASDALAQIRRALTAAEQNMRDDR